MKTQAQKRGMRPQYFPIQSKSLPIKPYRSWPICLTGTEPAQAVSEYIKVDYNRTRRHSANGFISQNGSIFHVYLKNRGYKDE